MSSDKIDCKKYLHRIGFVGELRPDLKALKSLHKNHLLAIPFENLDIHRKHKIILDINALEKKILFNYRGGFCYELNGLFYALLREIGYPVKMVSARVFDNNGVPGPEFDHMALIVSLADDWLVDVGFGENFLHPLKISLNEIQKDPVGDFMIDRESDLYLRLNMRRTGEIELVSKYLFSQQSRELSDFQPQCDYLQTSQKSEFTQKRFCSSATNDGRITLSDNNLKVTRNGRKTEQKVSSEAEFDTFLWEKFQIKLAR